MALFNLLGRETAEYISEAEDNLFCFLLFVSSIYPAKMWLPMFVQSPMSVMPECGDLKVTHPHKTLNRLLSKYKSNTGVANLHVIWEIESQILKSPRSS
jgi:hypothetical protein